MMQIDLQCSMLIGSAMAFAARRRLARASPEWIADAHIAVLVFAGLVFAPVWLYITLRWTAWETMYLWDLSTVPRGLVAAFLPALSLAALGGFALTHHLLVGGRPGLCALANGLAAASCAIVALGGWDRATFVGSLADFAAGARPNLLRSDLVLAFGVAGALVFTPAAILTLRWLRSPSLAPKASECRGERPA
jgi:hypothetical protein